MTMFLTIISLLIVSVHNIYAADPACSLPLDSGPCKANIPVFGYNTTTQDCVQFIYGGCQGNENNYNTLAECEAACEDNPSTDPSCSLPLDPGPCRANIPVFGYNTTTQDCVQFIYGGCQGNENNYNTLAECEAACEDNPSTDLPDRCYLPKDSGRCRNRLPRFYYNAVTQVCESFTYGGCEGNDNRFETIQECQTVCKQLPSGNSAVPY